jgi:hypothetical protein
MTLTPAEVIAQLPATFEKATTAGELFFFGSNILTLESFGVDVRHEPCPWSFVSLKKPYTDPSPSMSGPAKESIPTCPLHRCNPKGRRSRQGIRPLHASVQRSLRRRGFHPGSRLCNIGSCFTHPHADVITNGFCIAQ